MNIHVSNLHPNLIEADLQRLFTAFGEVKSVELVRDKLNNRSRGRAFVEMQVEAEGQKAMERLHGTEFKGKVLSLSEVRYDPAFSTHVVRNKVR
jgi:RNA recognition motif-containing protein